MSSRSQTRGKSLTLVLGGAQSGKSYYAQRLATEFQVVTFIATAQASDGEMREKIARHRAERPAGWRTIEAPFDLSARIRSESRDADALVVDCLTVYVSNLMSRRKRGSCNQKHHIDNLCGALQEVSIPVIVVSNEVGSGVVPPYRSGRVFRDFLGQMNRRVAEIAGTVVLMIAGLPLIVKSAQLMKSPAGTRIADATMIDVQSANGVRKGN
ncbi:MAG TPA: bifunctional adenosylcobinamide kinase/adenosylcobinamide-phosphate guanylyltransferase [Candidatus Acidoferrales bacterium]|nr:bifunctional adenosylcobinamide kinase/adenosylcobinamide-phosphate guanylyltransferase [Candidatus Acidoferrales bacterium]